jgi:predicted metal-binding membrane protein
MNRNVVIAVVVVIVVIAFASLVFTNINRSPDAGTGDTAQDNVAGGVPEVGEQVGNNDGSATPATTTP